MKLSEYISTIFENNTKKSIQFSEFLSKINHKGFGVLLAVLALPSALPFSIPGFSTPFGLAEVFLGSQLVLNRQYPWFPKVIMEKNIPTGDSKFVEAMIKFLRFFEKFSKPRIKILSGGIFYRLSGVLIVLCGISMLLPTPFTNSLPAFAIFLIGLGLLEEDGLLILFGLVAAICGMIVTSLVLFLIFSFGWEGVNIIRTWVGALV
jgi:hypothetical protein